MLYQGGLSPWLRTGFSSVQDGLEPIFPAKTLAAGSGVRVVLLVPMAIALTAPFAFSLWSSRSRVLLFGTPPCGTRGNRCISGPFKFKGQVILSTVSGSGFS
jgi:hypothetical protein